MEQSKSTLSQDISLLSEADQHIIKQFEETFGEDLIPELSEALLETSPN